MELSLTADSLFITILILCIFYGVKIVRIVDMLLPCGAIFACYTCHEKWHDLVTRCNLIFNECTDCSIEAFNSEKGLYENIYTPSSELTDCKNLKNQAAVMALVVGLITFCYTSYQLCKIINRIAPQR